MYFAVSVIPIKAPSGGNSQKIFERRQDAMYDSVGSEMALGLGALLIPMLISLVVCLILVIAQWKIFTKAGKPGWACLVPIYNMYVLFEIAEGNGVKCFLTLIPLIGFVFPIIATFKLAKAFGYGGLFGLGLLVFPYICWPILGFGNNSYIGPQ